MDTPSPLYRCRSCGASSYQRLVHRDLDGVMRYSGVYKCSGCPLEFSQLGSWREQRQSLKSASTEASSGSDQPVAPVPQAQQGGMSLRDSFALR